jgi:uncharacterized protein YbjT (DUF2867 family)
MANHQANRMANHMPNHCVFVTGATGYVGHALVARLTERGHGVRALARPESVASLPAVATPIVGDALNARSYASAVAPADTLVHLVGTPHPNPRKAREFRAVDLASIREAAHAAKRARIAHIVYVSVAQPAPVMRAYVEVRREGEAIVRATNIPATILRPWYVLGPGHRWPILLAPLYTLFELLPATRDSARRLGLVSLAQMVCALVHAVEHRPPRVRICEVPEIRSCELASTQAAIGER